MSSEEKTWGGLCHFLALAGYIIPFGNIIGPIIIWALKKEQSAFVDQQGRESINFQINMIIWLVVCFLLMFVLIGFLLLPLVAILNLVFVIIAGIQAAGGQPYRYPLPILRLV